MSAAISRVSKVCPDLYAKGDKEGTEQKERKEGEYKTPEDGQSQSQSQYRLPLKS